jgi:hypothetical protein
MGQDDTGETVELSVTSHCWQHEFGGPTVEASAASLD